MRTCYLFALLVAFSASTTAFAAGDSEALIKKYNCTTCHAAATKKTGPTWTAIAAKYKGDKGAQARLEAKVRFGGKGSFGAIPMSPTKGASDADIKAMVAWILGYK